MSLLETISGPDDLKNLHPGQLPDLARDIREVLEDERELVRPVIRLEPIAVLKG